jgi:hypothetical protein
MGCNLGKILIHGAIGAKLAQFSEEFLRAGRGELANSCEDAWFQEYADIR